MDSKECPWNIQREFSAIESFTQSLYFQARLLWQVQMLICNFPKVGRFDTCHKPKMSDLLAATIGHMKSNYIHQHCIWIIGSSQQTDGTQIVRK